MADLPEDAERISFEITWDNALRALEYEVVVDGDVVDSGSSKGPDIDGAGGVLRSSFRAERGAQWTLTWSGFGGSDASSIAGECFLTYKVWGE
jgi:hypothetical protein